MAEDSVVPPPHPVDAPWINKPILFTSGPLRGKWIRTELTIVQQPMRGRKGAIHDLRPLHPPPTVQLRLYETFYPEPPRSLSSSDGGQDGSFYHSEFRPPPADAPERLIPIDARLTTHLLCFASLFKTHPPTREFEYHRVDRKIVTTPSTGQSNLNATHSQPPAGSQIIERPKSDKPRHWKMTRPHPMTAISCRDPRWNTAVMEARSKAAADGKRLSPVSSPVDGQLETIGGVECIEGDLPANEMAILEPYLPRESPKWILPYRDVTSQLSKRETAGHLIPSNETGESALYFVFSDLAIKTEGYFGIRFHIVNLNWAVDARFSRGGPGLFSPLADCVTNTFAVYSTKEFPGLPVTTEFTSYLVSQGVRIRYRDDRAVEAGDGNGIGRTDARSRARRRNSGRPGFEVGSDSMGEKDSEPKAEPDGGDNMATIAQDAWSPKMLEEANQMALRSRSIGPFGSLLAADFSSENGVHSHDSDDVTAPSTSSPQQRRALIRSQTFGSSLTYTSPMSSPTFRDRRARSSSNTLFTISQTAGSYVQGGQQSEAAYPSADATPIPPIISNTPGTGNVPTMPNMPSLSNLDISSFPPSLHSTQYDFQPVPLSAPPYPHHTAEWSNAARGNHPATHGHAQTVLSNPAGTSPSLQPLQTMQSMHTYPRMEPQTPSQPEVSPQLRRFSISGEYPTMRDVAAPSGSGGAFLSQIQTQTQTHARSHSQSQTNTHSHSQSFSQTQTQSPTYAQLDAHTPSQQQPQQLPQTPTHMGSAGRGQHRYNPYPSSSPVQSHNGSTSPHERHFDRPWQRNGPCTTGSVNRVPNGTSLRDSTAQYMTDYDFMSLGDQAQSQTHLMTEEPQQYNDYQE